MYGYAIAFFPFLPSRAITRPIVHAIVAPETERKGVSLVRSVRFFFSQSPLGWRQIGKERVTGQDGVDHREVDAMPPCESMSIDLRASGDEDFGVSCDQYQRRVEVVADFDTRSPPGAIARQYHVAASGKRLADAIECLPPHDHRMTHGERLEPLHIGREVPGQGVVPPDDPVVRHRSDQGNDQTATLAEMWG